MLLHYRLIEKIGEGGMGVVWRAADTTLDREVAIKVLPDAFLADAGRLARFEREAKVLASLNHPNIASIHGLHEAGSVRFLAMELVTGVNLSQHLAQGAPPLDESLRMAGQIAEALEAAHANGVVHRDLKPANIQIASDGKVKVLDFGLAKLPEATGSSANLSVSPTVTSGGTLAGTILGTAAYMSPEQAGLGLIRGSIGRVRVWGGLILVDRTAHYQTLGLRKPALNLLPAGLIRGGMGDLGVNSECCWLTQLLIPGRRHSENPVRISGASGFCVGPMRPLLISACAPRSVQCCDARSSFVRATVGNRGSVASHRCGTATGRRASGCRVRGDGCDSDSPLPEMPKPMLTVRFAQAALASSGHDAISHRSGGRDSPGPL
jgi:hypothetical protein